MSKNALQKHIAETLRRNLGILKDAVSIEHAGETWIPLAQAERVGDACAANLAQTIPELDRSAGVAAHDFRAEAHAAIYGMRRDTPASDVLVPRVAAELQTAYAAGARAERLTLNREWETQKAADDARAPLEVEIERLREGLQIIASAPRDVAEAEAARYARNLLAGRHPYDADPSL